MDRPAPTVPFRDALRFWATLGFINFGGPTAQIAIMHTEVVERRRWIDEDRFLHALSFCMLLPGPEAQQLAVYLGWLMHGTAGGVVAGVLFIAPAAVLMLALAWIYAAFGEISWVAGVFAGLSAAVVGVVAAAMLTIGAKALKSRPALVLAIAAFVAIFVVGVPFPLLLVTAAAIGAWLGPERMVVSAESVPDPGPRPSWAQTARTAALWLAIWMVPLLVVAAVLGTGSVPARASGFFGQVAVVSFGGAYAVLVYVGREVVTRFGLSTTDVVAGLGLAETTPGPLILVVEFLGFLAAYRNPGELPPAVAGLIGAAVTLWAIFVPSFLWIFAGAPWVERLRANRGLRASLAAITACVVGVIAALAVTLGVAALFDQTRAVSPFTATIALPMPGSLDALALVVALGAFLAVRRFRVHVIWVVLASGLAGLLDAVLR